MFKNLNMEDPELNSLSTEEYSQVWKPAIRFLNKEPNSKARKKIYKQISSMKVLMMILSFFPNEVFSFVCRVPAIVFSALSMHFKVLSVITPKKTKS